MLFIVTPYTRKAHNNEVKCSGDVDTAYIRVEPTARLILTPEADTLCNEQFVNIQVTIPTGSTNGVRYKFTVEAPPGVDVDPIPAYDLNSGVPIIDSISNTTLDAQRVLIIITPYTRDNNDNEKCPGKIDTAVVWINPTPVISVSLLDTLFCNDSPAEFSVGTENGFIIGDKVYDITAVIGPNITGVTEGPGFDHDGTGFTDF